MLCLGIFLLSTPIAALAVFYFEQDRQLWAIINSYGFSIGYNLLYAYPLVVPLSPFTWFGFKQRVHKAQMNWIIWLSVFTQICFQIPHNIFVAQLHHLRGSLVEWPFFAYGFSDSRWSDYNAGSGVADQFQPQENCIVL